MDEMFTCKICDFGIAKIFKKNTEMGIAGTVGWMAPEIYNNNIVDASKVDIYSFGMVLYELITHEIPYPETKDANEVMQLSLNGRRPIINEEQEIRNSEKIMDELINLFYKCTELDPILRPSFSDITKILFFPIPGRIELTVDQKAEVNIQTFNRIQDAIDSVQVSTCSKRH